MKFTRLNTAAAIAVCVLLPVVSYFVIKNYTDNHVKLPRRYFYDRVRDTTVDGKRKVDTLWHQVRNVRMVNQYGDTVSLDALKGKVLVVSFFFTHCPTICPALTRSMLMVQKAVARDSGIHLLSITIDPDRDSVTVLRKYAQQYGIHSNNWWLCRLVGDSVGTMMFNEFKAGYKQDSVIQFDHSSDIYLLDKNRVVRGKSGIPAVVEPGDERASRFYDGTDSADMFQLITDASLVKLEKLQKGKPPVNLLILSMVIVGATFIFILWYNRRKKRSLLPGA